MKAPHTVALLIAFCGTCSAQQQSASELIRFLTYQTDRPDKLMAEMGVFSCGVPVDDLQAASALVKLGPTALLDIKQEFAAMQRRGYPGLGATWIETAYALIRGPAAFELLRTMEEDTNGPDQPFGDDNAFRQFDGAIALSLNLTSFVSAPNRPGDNYHQCRDGADRNRSMLSSETCPPGTHAEPLMVIHCDRPSDPRDALDRLIRAFETNDDFLFEAGLGPEAKTKWASLLKERTWSQIRAELLQGKSRGDFAMGYRFEPSGRWSEPDASLERNRAGHDRPESPTLATQFETGSGADCGSYRVAFRISSTPPGHLTPYLVNNSDLGGLLQVIAACLIKQ